MKNYKNIESLMDLDCNDTYNQFNDDDKQLLLNIIYEFYYDYTLEFEYFEDQIKNNQTLYDIFFNTDNLIDFLNSFKTHPMLFIDNFLRYIGLGKSLYFLNNSKLFNEDGLIIYAEIGNINKQLIKFEIINSENEFYIIKLNDVKSMDLIRKYYKPY